MRRTALPRGRPLARGTTELARGAPLARKAPQRRPQARRLSAEPEGARLCQGRQRGAPGGCWGGLHRHHVVRRSQGGADTPGNLLWLCAGHHAWAHDHPADARALGLLA